MDQAKIGAFIARRRRELDMTQAQLAEKLAVTDKAVSKWETGRGLPDTSLLEPLCRELGVSLGELFAGEQVPPADLTERTEQAAIGLFALLQEWGRQRKVIGGAFFLVLALDVLLAVNELFLRWGGPETRQMLQGWIPSLNLMLLFLGAAFARNERDSRPVQRALLLSCAVLLLSALAAWALCAMDGGLRWNSPLFWAGIRAGTPCELLFYSFFLSYNSTGLFFPLTALAAALGVYSAARALGHIGKK